MIGEKTISKIKAMTADQIDTYAGKVNQAFLKSDDGKLKVTLSIDLSVSTVKAGGIDCDVSIGFVADRIKDKISETIVENQVEMNLAAVKGGRG